MTGLLALAFTAGLVSPVNPCGFALLPAWLAYHLDTATTSQPTAAAGRLGGGLRAGLALTAGYAGTLTAAGLLITAGARPLLSVAPWLALTVGALLAAAGLAAIAGRQIPVRLPSRLADAARRGTGGGLVALGAGYALASLGCTIGLLLAVIAQALATASLAGAAAVFAAYTIGAATLLLMLAAATSLAGGALTRLLRRGLPILHRASGAIMLAAGAYLVAYWLPASRGHTPGRGLPNLAPLAGRVSGWIQTHQIPLAALTALTIAAAITVAITGRRRRRSRESGCPSATQPADTTARAAVQDPETSRQ